MIRINYQITHAYIAFIIALAPALTVGQETIAERDARKTKIAKLYKMAEQAYKDGDIETSRDTLRTVLAEQPGHPHATALLRKIKLNSQQIEVKKRKRIFDSVMIKEVNYKRISLAQALKILSAQVTANSKKLVIPNFVITDPKKYLGNEKIELQMNNVPAGVVLENLMKKTGTTAKFGKYSISIRPRPSVYDGRKSKTKPVAKKKTDEE